MKPQFLLVAIAFEGLLTIAAFGLGWLVGISPWYQVRGDFWTLEGLTLDLLWGLAATAPAAAVLLLEDHPRWRALTDLKHQVTRLMERLMHGAAYWQLFLLAVFAGLGEELLFRGLLQVGLMWLLPASIAVIGSLLIASVVFGLCHYLSHTYFILATAAGVYFGLLMLFSGSILPAIIAHALYDFVALVYLRSEQPVCWRHSQHALDWAAEDGTADGAEESQVEVPTVPDQPAEAGEPDTN